MELEKVIYQKINYAAKHNKCIRLWLFLILFILKHAASSRYTLNGMIILHYYVY